MPGLKDFIANVFGEKKADKIIPDDMEVIEHPLSDIDIIIQQIEKKTGKRLDPIPLKEIRRFGNGFAMDNTDQVVGLNLDDTKIKDISLLKNLGGLTHLSLAKNQITDLTPLGDLTKLTKLFLGGNQITDLKPLGVLTNLTYIDLGNNQITDLTPLRELKQLEYFDVRNNCIQRLPGTNPGILQT